MVKLEIQDISSPDVVEGFFLDIMPLGKHANFCTVPEQMLNLGTVCKLDH